MEIVKNERQQDTKQCPDCRTTNPDDADFCGGCGKRLNRQPEPSRKKPTASIIKIIALIVIVAIVGIAGYLLYIGAQPDRLGKDPDPPGTDTVKSDPPLNSTEVISTRIEKDTLINEPLPDSLIEWSKEHSRKNRK
jgi:predicted nucleic acid-binding Zn ribbon protein